MSAKKMTSEALTQIKANYPKNPWVKSYGQLGSITFARESGKIRSVFCRDDAEPLRDLIIRTLKPSQDAVICSVATGEVFYYYEGVKNGVPIQYSQELGHVDNYVPNGHKRLKEAWNGR